MRSFVALDLELTPFSGDQQRIIEIAAACFLDGELVDTFSTLVDPGCDLTPRIEALTGIHQDQVDSAPSFDAVVPRLLALIGSRPLVGQSIDLDLRQLAARGLRFQNRVYDTFELASLLLPGLPSYDLRSIALALGVELEREHRALGDALVAGRVFMALSDRASMLSLDVLRQVNALGRRLPDWALGDLFAESQARVARMPLTPPVLQPSSQPHGIPLRPSPETVPLSLDLLKSLLRPGGPIASALPSFEERTEQIRMMEAVAESLNSGDHLLVEAGTGTGKSLAYLLPAIVHAVNNGRPVVVSTNTLNLQDQLYHKDIPALQRCLALNFRAALLKGRANYLCLRRWQLLSRSPNLDPAEVMLLIKTLIWLSITATGDRSELNLSTTEMPLWPRISAQAESCALMKCPQFRRGKCFVVRARKDAENAHVIVVNHALLLTDLALCGGILPEYSQVIIDEAHHLEDEATDQLSFTASWAELFSFLLGLYQLSPGQRPAGFMADLAGALRQPRLDRDTSGRISSLISAAKQAVETALEEGRSFFEVLHCFLRDHGGNRTQAGGRLRITSSVRVQPDWSEVEVRWGELSERLESLRQIVLRLALVVEGMDDTQIIEREGVLAEMAGTASYLDRLRDQGGEIVSSPGTNGIYWIGSGSSLADLAIRSAPLHVGEALNRALFSCKDSVILTSATLTTEGSFDYIRERLGLEEARELVVGSPFDYRRSTMLYLVQDIPEPTKPACQRAVESTIADLVLAVGGRTLVLFTSHAQLRATCSTIRQRLEHQGILVLAHGLDGSRRRLLQAFKATPRAVLMGTNSFWEGIDIVGEALSCLVIVKLPFSVPTDPIFAARSEAFEEPFRQFSVPQTILRFRQGFGRLIRSRTDRGIVVVLDSRVGSKFYGPAFIQSLPACTMHLGSAGRVAEAAQAWLGRSQNP